MIMAKYKGLTVSVYRDDMQDCTNNGISANRERFILVDDQINAPFETDNDNEVLTLVRRDLGGKIYVHAEPIHKPKNTAGAMFGGNFIYSSDSRFSAINKYPIPIHDRFETSDIYNSMD